jgi:hypothetical protein
METPADWTTSSETDQGTENLPSGCWMERMNNHYENRLWKLLEKEKLTDLSQFHQPESFDEVPLFSRESDIEFLLKDDAASEILLRFALKFLKSVIAYEEHQTAYFAAITVWSLSADPLVPNLFVWCGDVRDLKEKLALDAATTSFGKQIKKLVSKLHLDEEFEVREDTSTLPDATRAFIVPERPPYQGFVPLTAFRKQAKAAK